MLYDEDAERIYIYSIGYGDYECSYEIMYYSRKDISDEEIENLKQEFNKIKEDREKLCEQAEIDSGYAAAKNGRFRKDSDREKAFLVYRELYSKIPPLSHYRVEDYLVEKLGLQILNSDKVI